MALSKDARERRLRRIAKRLGYRLIRSSRRPEHLVGYQIADISTNGLVAGWGKAGHGYAMTLKDVEEWLTQRSQQ